MPATYCILADKIANKAENLLSTGAEAEGHTQIKIFKKLDQSEHRVAGSQSVAKLAEPWWAFVFMALSFCKFFTHSLLNLNAQCG
jgi:hypothetical protein